MDPDETLTIPVIGGKQGVINPVLPAIIGGVAAVAGSALANRSARKEADKNRAFQTAMSNTAHQRAVADMRKAGLNPILAAGNPASTPTGGQANITAPDIARGGTAAALAKQQIQTQKAQAGSLSAQAVNFTQQAAEAQQRTLTHAQETRLAEARANLAEARLPGDLHEAELHSGTWGNINRYLNYGANSAGSIGSAIGSAKNAILGGKGGTGLKTPKDTKNFGKGRAPQRGRPPKKGKPKLGVGIKDKPVIAKPERF